LIEFQLPSLSYLRLRFHLKAQEDCTLPSWKGSLLRGAFGHALKRTVCTMKTKQLCETCMLREQCAYTRLFETFITKEPPPFLKGLDTSPRPFIFEPSDKNQKYNKGDTLWFDLILIGNIADYLPYVIFAVFQMGQTGLGVNRHRFDLEHAYCFQPGETSESSQINGEWQMLYDGNSQMILFTPESVAIGNSDISSPSDNVTLNFLTQTRLKFQNELTMDFTFRMLVFKMLRRILELSHFYSDDEKINWEFPDLLAAANDVSIAERNLCWEDWGRYSNRQKTKMKIGGFIGSLNLEGDLNPFVDLLAYTEVLHVGKGTTFGLGRISII